MTQTEFRRKPESNQAFEEMLLLNVLGKVTHTALPVSTWLNCLQKRASCFSQLGHEAHPHFLGCDHSHTP